MMWRLAERPGLIFGLVFAWKLALLLLTAQPIPSNDSFFYDGPVVNFLLHDKYANPALALVLPISGNEVFSAYPPLYQFALLGWMAVFGTSALSAMGLHLLLFGIYELILYAILRRLQIPATCINLAGLFLLSITFHDRPDSLAHVFGMASVYACVRSRKCFAGEYFSVSLEKWAWLATFFSVLTLGTSLQIGSFYLLLIGLLWLASAWLMKERFPVLPTLGSLLIPASLVLLVVTGFPQLWAGFKEHAALTPSFTGLRVPQLNELLKIIRTVPGVLAATIFLLWLLRRREIFTQRLARDFLLMTCAATHVALTVVATSLFALTPNMVQIANYLQPLVVAGFFALLIAASTSMASLRKLTAVFVVLAGLVSIRAIGMSTWGVVCARDVRYSTAIQSVRDEMKTVPSGGAVIVSSAYLYEAARRSDVRWIHSDWPGKTDFTDPNWERDALIALKPASLIITQFDYFRRYEAVLAALQRDALVQFELENTATLPAPDSMPSLQKVVQHISWAPVVVRFSWASAEN